MRKPWNAISSDSLARKGKPTEYAVALQVLCCFMCARVQALVKHRAGEGQAIVIGLRPSPSTALTLSRPGEPRGLTVVSGQHRHLSPEFSSEVADIAKSLTVRDRSDREIGVHEIVSGGR
jgi:hypothetical protein